MRGLFLRTLLNAVALFAVDYVLDGFHVEGWAPLLVSAFLLGVVNAFVRPVLKFLTFPINLLTLGLWSLILNLLLFLLVINAVNGVEITNFWWGVGTWVLYSLLVALLGTLIRG